MSVVVVGGGHAGGQFSASLRQLKYSDPITLIGAESSLPYQRPPLSKEYLAQEIGLERVLLRPMAFYEKNDIAVHLNRTVQAIDRAAKVIELDDKTLVSYETLVLATGSSPIRPPIPGIDLDGVHLLRTIHDVDTIVADLHDETKVGVIGGGYIGLEVAASLRKLGHQVAVVELENRPLKRVATESISSYFLNLHEKHGVDFHLGCQVAEIRDDGSGHVAGLNTADGTQLDFDMIVVGVGIRPNTELAANATLDVSDGIQVNEFCETIDPDIYAIGDCTNHPNPLLDRRLRLESVPNAMEQSRVAASNILGEKKAYASYPWFWSDQYDIKLQMVGFAMDRDEYVSRGDSSSSSFIDFHLRDGVVIGADAVNSPREFLAARQLCGKSVDAKRLGDEATDLKALLSG